MTSSPLDTPQARIASWRASVPLPTPIECLVPMYEANSWSNALTFGPMVSCMLSSTSSIAARTSSRIVTCSKARSEEHTSELQSPYDLVCRLLLEKKKQNE